MKSTGEVMAIERTFEAALSKALRALEQRLPDASQLRGRPDLLHQPNDRRLMAAMQALRDGAAPDEVGAATGYAPWFVDRLAYITALEGALAGPLDAHLRLRAKRPGFDDARIAELRGGRLPGTAPRRPLRHVHTRAARFQAGIP